MAEKISSVSLEFLPHPEVAPPEVLETQLDLALCELQETQEIFNLGTSERGMYFDTDLCQVDDILETVQRHVNKQTIRLPEDAPAELKKQFAELGISHFRDPTFELRIMGCVKHRSVHGPDKDLFAKHRLATVFQHALFLADYLEQKLEFGEAMKKLQGEYEAATEQCVD